MMVTVLRLIGGSLYWASDALERIADLFIHESNMLVERPPKMAPPPDAETGP